MEIACIIIAWLLVALGFLGCFVNKIPGPLLSFLGLVIFAIGCGIKADWWVFVLVGLLVIVSMVVNKKYAPKLGALVAPFGKGGSWGTTLGSLIGLCLIAALANGGTTMAIISIVCAFGVLPYFFAFLFELIAKKSAATAAQAATGAYVTFLVTTMLKLAVCAYSIYALIAYA
ncbi:MAG: DUF456 family protein [Muribaculaceae bacterium]|nr:DUF456 family protein [Muribaculaceae bacterium]MBQ7852035.1 DUF456 family protein [Muribaculaceae bacterium]